MPLVLNVTNVGLSWETASIKLSPMALLQIYFYLRQVHRPVCGCSFGRSRLLRTFSAPSLPYSPHLLTTTTTAWHDPPWYTSAFIQPPTSINDAPLVLAGTRSNSAFVNPLCTDVFLASRGTMRCLAPPRNHPVVACGRIVGAYRTADDSLGRCTAIQPATAAAPSLYADGDSGVFSGVGGDASVSVPPALSAVVGP